VRDLQAPSGGWGAEGEGAEEVVEAD